jgi:hypothetical protein
LVFDRINDYDIGKINICDFLATSFVVG